MEEINKTEAMPSPPPRPDISKSVVIILVILSVVISMVGTWVILGEVNMMDSTPQIAQESSASGKVRLAVLNTESMQMSTSGKVSISILNKEE